MKSFSRTLTTCVASAALLVVSAGLAQAYDPDAPATDVAEAIAAVAPDAGEVLEASSAGGAFVSQTGDASVVVPRSLETPVALTNANPEVPDLTVALPDLAGADTVRQAEDGTLVYTSDDAASVAVQPLADGSTRFLSVLENESAPERYDYTFEGFALALQEDGSVLVLDGGLQVGVIAAPWATDADGVSVPTRYEVEGSTLSQVVDHVAGNSAYPIAADPKVTVSWWNTTVYLNKRDMNDLAFVAGGAALVARRIPNPALRGAVEVSGTGIATAAAWALGRGKCMKFVFYGHIFGPKVPQLYGGSEAGGYCR